MLTPFLSSNLIISHQQYPKPPQLRWGLLRSVLRADASPDLLPGFQIWLRRYRDAVYVAVAVPRAIKYNTRAYHRISNNARISTVCHLRGGASGYRHHCQELWASSMCDITPLNNFSGSNWGSSYRIYYSGSLIMPATLTQKERDPSYVPFLDSLKVAGLSGFGIARILC